MTDVQVTLSLPVLKVGSSPESGPTVIEHLQLMLNQRGGFPILTEDGEFGPSTEASVKHYQQNENLTVDGVVGKQTWTSLLNKWLLQWNPVRTRPVSWRTCLAAQGKPGYPVQVTVARTPGGSDGRK